MDHIPGESSPPTRRAARRAHGRAARALLTLLVALAALVIGLVAGRWLYTPAGATDDPAEGTAGTTPMTQEQWYTCGMHPNVLQKGPGDCPICHMKLTPLKKQDEQGGGASPAQERRVLYWRAPMDPNYVSDKPGKSPMGMDLVPVYADADESASAHAIRIDPVTIQNMGIRTGVIQRGPLVKVIRTVGRVDYNEQAVTYINTKFRGWIERLYVDQTGQHVARGQELFDVYSPDLYAAQEEFLAATRNLPLLEGSTFPPAIEEATRLVDAAVTKLKYMDVSDEQIGRIRERKQVEKTLTIHSPAEGIVTEKLALDGMYVMPGMRLYTVADLSRIWVYVDIYEYQLPWVYAGQPARMTLPYVTGREFTGKVIYVYPYLEPRTRVIKVRLEFENPDLELKPGMYANVRLDSELSREATLVPREAYIDSGERKVAFVDRGDGKFQPREILTGVEAEDGMVEVLYGLEEGEVVVTSGQFLIDAESKLVEAVAKMMEAERAKPVPRTPDTPVAHASPGEIPPQARYACPMEEHPAAEAPDARGAYFSAEAGTCPECGMELKPLEELDWVRLRRMAQGADMAFTCPDHPHVFSRSAAPCPRCGRDLMPFKVMYTCPDPDHSGVIRIASGDCPDCGRTLAAFRGAWLDGRMPGDNMPPSPGLAEAAAYRCPIHPLVHSDAPGRCTICAEPLQETPEAVRPDAAAVAPGVEYVCPMHPRQVTADGPGSCTICGMQLVRASTFPWPVEAAEHVDAQVNYLTEHYLELQALLASDRTTDVARQALALVAASEELIGHVDHPAVNESRTLRAATERLRSAALKFTGNDVAQDRVTFVELSAAMRDLIATARPSRDRWPKLYIYHCPMSKGDWIQDNESKRNPYYGFKMLSCGELKDVR
jgi:Cu(I)/Ag(I) efflux system membrane fusion protein/cobalt-zinc-cadmium efflux system membrane fusion protein